MRAGDNDGAGGATAGVPRMRASNTTTTFLFFPFFLCLILGSHKD